MNTNELNEVKGGAKLGIAIAGAIGAFITFVIGIFDGYQRPLSCNK